MKLTPFVEYLLHDAFIELDNVNVKHMFGGYGFYLDGRIFGFTIDDDTLVLKADDASKEKFESRGCKQFIYEGHTSKKPTAMPYWTVPDDVMEDPHQLAQWARESAALSQPK